MTDADGFQNRRKEEKFPIHSPLKQGYLSKVLCDLI